MKVFISGHELDGDAIDPMQCTFAEAIDIEEATGLTWDEFVDKLGRGSFVALRGLCWIALRRSQPTLRIIEVNPKLADFTIVPDDPESATEATPDPTDAAAAPEAPAAPKEPAAEAVPVEPEAV